MSHQELIDRIKDRSVLADDLVYDFALATCNGKLIDWSKVEEVFVRRWSNYSWKRAKNRADRLARCMR